MTKYSVASATATADGTQVDTAQGIGITIKDALDKGHKVTMTKYGTAANTVSVNWEVVKELGDDEIAATVWNNAATDTVNELLTAAVAGGSTPLGTAAALTADNLRATSLGGTDKLIQHRSQSAQMILQSRKGICTAFTPRCSSEQIRAHHQQPGQCCGEHDSGREPDP